MGVSRRRRVTLRSVPAGRGMRNRAEQYNARIAIGGIPALNRRKDIQWYASTGKTRRGAEPQRLGIGERVSWSNAPTPMGRMPARHSNGEPTAMTARPVHHLRDNIRRMNLGCMTPWAMCWNGCRIAGTRVTTARQVTVAHGSVGSANGVRFEAAPGYTRQGACGPPAAAERTRRTAS